MTAPTLFDTTPTPAATTAAGPGRLVPSDDPAAYERWRRRQIGYGRWQPYTDAQPAREHVQYLMATTGLGWRRLADLAGISRSTMTYLLYGNNGRRATRITPENSRRLLALQPGTAHGLTVTAVGTHRRLHVLAGEGWPQIHLGPHIGTHPQYVSQILKIDRVTTTTAQAVADAYEHLRGADPLAHGVSHHGVALAKATAVRNGWPDRAFWDDYDRIDDPEFEPERPEPKRLRIEEVAEDAAWLVATADLTHAQVAERLGVSRDYVDKALRHARSVA